MTDDSAKDKLKALALETEGEKTGYTAWVPGWLKAAFPYLGTGAIIAYLYFSLRDEVSGEMFWVELENANIPLFLLARCSLFVLGFLLCDALVFAKIFTWFYKPMRVRDLLPMRGYTMMYTILHPAIGQGWWFAFLVRKSGQTVRTVVGVSLITGIVVLYMSIGVLGYLYYTVHAGIVEIEVVSEWILIAAIAVLTFVAFQSTTYFVFKWKWGFLDKYRDGPIFSVMGLAKVRHYAIIFAIRFPQLILIILSEYGCARAFNIDISLIEFVTRFPIVLVHLLIPSVANVGPMTAGWLVAYEGFGTKEAIIVCTMLQIVVGHLTKVIIGLVSWGPAGEDARTIRLHDDEPGPRVSEEVPVPASD